MCDGEVVLKLVVGCNGSNATSVAEAIRGAGEEPRTLQAVLTLMERFAFGCPDCRVVATRDTVRVSGGLDGAAESQASLSRYRERFIDPRFNPRWGYGTADCTEIVTFRSGPHRHERSYEADAPL